MKLSGDTYKFNPCQHSLDSHSYFFTLSRPSHIWDHPMVASEGYRGLKLTLKEPEDACLYMDYEEL